MITYQILTCCHWDIFCQTKEKLLVLCPIQIALLSSNKSEAIKCRTGMMTEENNTIIYQRCSHKNFPIEVNSVRYANTPI